MIPLSLAPQRLSKLLGANIIPFLVLPLVAILFMKGVKKLTADHVEAIVEHGQEQ